MPRLKAKARAAPGSGGMLSVPFASTLITSRPAANGAPANRLVACSIAAEMSVARLRRQARLCRCAGRLTVAKARLTESVTQACGDRDRRCFRFDQQPGYRRREVALARPREDREADPAVVTSGNGLEKVGVDDRLDDAIELQRLILGSDRAGDVDRRDHIGIGREGDLIGGRRAADRHK